MSGFTTRNGCRSNLRRLRACSPRRLAVMIHGFRKIASDIGISHKTSKTF
ncbi:MAG: hypothetical protein KC736_05110 [Candidatus Moranbacteria bacterium]|nr:hypothetical protein [Candidatus Moranbacteria bacterium]